MGASGASSGRPGVARRMLAAMVVSASASAGLAGASPAAGRAAARRAAAEAHGTALCEHYGGDAGGVAPFAYFRRLPNGSKEEVGAVADPDSGLCVYPEASCEAGGQEFKCCELTKGYTQVLSGMQASTVNMIANYVVLIVARVIYNRALMTKEERAEAKPPCTVLNVVRAFAVIGAIGAAITAQITLATMSQQALDVPTRNAMMIATAFLEPIREIFQFLEDIVTVKMNYAIGQGDVPLARRVLALGVFGGAAVGTAAAALMTALVFCPGLVDAVLAPFAFNTMYDGCSLVPTAAEVVARARPYVLWRIWAWPFAFANMSLAGFLVGKGEYIMFAMLMLIEQVVTLVGLWNVFLPSPRLEVLGALAFVGSASATVLMICMLYARRQIRQEYLPLPPSCRKQGDLTLGERAESGAVGEGGGAANAAVAEFGAEGGAPSRANTTAFASVASWRDLAREGLLAMSVDLAAQVPIALGIYLASVRMGIGALYQISALQAAFPQYGTSWVAGLVFAMKIRGSTMISQGNFVAFKKLFTFCLLYTGLLAVSSAVTTLPFARPISFDLAAQACEYASTTPCLEVYASIFGGGSGAGVQAQSTLQGSSFDAFVPALIAHIFYKTFKAGLYACQDFRYMAKASGWILLCVLGPAMLAAALLDSPTAVFAAMYLPCLALAVVFASRTRSNIRGMLAGAAGPWSVEGAPRPEPGPEGSVAESGDGEVGTGEAGVRRVPS